MKGVLEDSFFKGHTTRRLLPMSGEDQLLLRDQLLSLDNQKKKFFNLDSELVKKDAEGHYMPPESGPFHCFLSHNWEHGQSEMRVIKTRLTEMLPGVSVFLGECPASYPTSTVNS